MQFNINVDINELFNRIVSILNEKGGKGIPVVTSIYNIVIKFLRIFGINGKEKSSDFNKMYYDKDYILKDLYDKNIKYEIKSYIDRANIENAYIDEKNNMKQLLMDFIKYIETEINNQYQMAIELENKVKTAANYISDMESSIKILQKKNKCIEFVIDCIRLFHNKWEEEIKL